MSGGRRSIHEVERDSVSYACGSRELLQRRAERSRKRNWAGAASQPCSLAAKPRPRTAAPLNCPAAAKPVWLLPSSRPALCCASSHPRLRPLHPLRRIIRRGPHSLVVSSSIFLLHASRPVFLQLTVSSTRFSSLPRRPSKHSKHTTHSPCTAASSPTSPVAALKSCLTRTTAL